MSQVKLLRTSASSPSACLRDPCCFLLHTSCCTAQDLSLLQVIDPVCGRHTAVLTSSKVLFKLSDGPDQPEVIVVPRHKKYEGAGKKATTKTQVCLLASVNIITTHHADQPSYQACFVSSCSVILI